MSSIILTPKQHKFCLKYVESGNASLAYREVYDCSGSKPSAVGKPKSCPITARLRLTTAIQHASAASSNHHRQLIQSIDEDRDFARQMGIPRLPFQQQWVARLFGLLRDRSEITNLHSVMIDDNVKRRGAGAFDCCGPGKVRQSDGACFCSELSSRKRMAIDYEICV